MSETTLTLQQEQDLCRLEAIAFGLKTALDSLEEQVHALAAEGRPTLTLVGGRNA